MTRHETTRQGSTQRARQDSVGARVRIDRRRKLGSNGSDKQQASWQDANSCGLVAAMMAGPGEMVVLVCWRCPGKGQLKGSDGAREQQREQKQAGVCAMYDSIQRGCN